MPTIVDIVCSWKQTVTSGAVTTIAAGTGTAGHILALRNATAGKAVRIRSIQSEFILTTAFGAAQRVGYDLLVARGYTAAHTGGNALDFSGGTGNARTSYSASILTGRIASNAALTAGTHTLNTNPIAKGSVWCGAVGTVLGPRFEDFSAAECGGILLVQNEGIVCRNTVLMGANGVGEWVFTIEGDDVIVAA